jgi:4,5-dihydroxyphthalate decarboxylase
MTIDLPVLSVAIGDYPHTSALKSGLVGSDLLRPDFATVKPISRAFAPMVRQSRFDVCEMAIATFLQGKAYGKALVLLPVVLAARFQESALLCRADAAISEPEDLVGRRVGVRAYSQTTGMWLRGILAEEHGVRPEQITWVTFEDAHVAEYQDPPWSERAAVGSDMLAMLHQGELDAVIVGNEVPEDPGLRTVFPDPVRAGGVFRRKHGFVPVNHLLVVRQELAESRPDLVAELFRMVKSSAELAPSPSMAVAQTPASLNQAIELAIRFSRDQGLLPRGLSVAETWNGLPPMLSLTSS